jgi:ABC-type transport system involved in multi-copper enzyme maturation permease subunit
MIQAYTILLDSLRMLRASKLFWISIWISSFVAIAYASIGFTPTGISIGFGLWEFDLAIMRKGTPESEAFYLLIFTDIIVRLWLGWFSLVLAIISTCSIFPQFLQPGAIDLAISKPVSRLRLFFLKYLGGLLFVAVQTALFCIVAFIAIGCRVGEWNLSVFWAVPVITFSFSLIYCVGVLIGVATRSTVFALLGALLFWGVTLIAQWSEDFVYKMAYALPEAGVSMNMQTGEVNTAEDDAGSGWRKSYEKIRIITNILPKTRECTLSLKRLIHFRQRDSMLSGFDLGTVFSGMESDPEMNEVIAKYENRHSWFSLFGTSLIFQLLILSLAARLMIRRDY